ncbi:MAG: hypothetical protein ACOH2J_06970 [Allorhizobium sp.]
MTAFRQVWTGGLRFLCVLALLSLAFAHKPPQVVATFVATASLQLPDGSYADLCVGDHGLKHSSANPQCEACRLSAAVLLPVPDTGSWLKSTFASLANQRTTRAQISLALSVERPRARGPPSLS